MASPEMTDEFIFDFYLLRSPSFPLESIIDFLSVSNLEDAEAYLRNSLSNSGIRDALLLSNPDLYNEIEKWLSSKKPINEKLLKTLYKYIIRMGSRCTPYGQFSGVCLGEFNSEINGFLRILRNNRKNSVKYRLDMQSIVSISHSITSDPNIKTRLKYSVNSTLYQQGDTYKFYQQLPNFNKLTNLLASVRSSPIMNYVLSETYENIFYDELIDVLLKKGASNQQAIDFVNKMIESQLIVSELHPSITGEDYFSLLIKKIARLDKEKNHLPSLQKVAKLLKSDIPLLLRQQKIKEALAGMYQSFQFKNLLQGDLLLGTSENKINKSFIEEIGKQLNTLRPLSINSSSTILERFKNEFSQRYESRMVSMLEALDPETGISYGKNPAAYYEQDDILKGIDLRKRNGFNIPNTHYQDLSLKLYSKSLKNGNSEVFLDDFDINAIKDKLGKPKQLPSSYFAIGNILKTKLDNSFLFNLCGFGGTSAGNLISRFGYLDRSLESKLGEINTVEQENFKNTIIAEIVHLPEARTGNILQRPDFRMAEIVLMARSSERRTSIKASDLFLFMSGNRLVLWSKSLNSEIIPRLTSAHNFYHGINIYRFLADLQSQEKRLDIRWDWGILKKEPFLPRIRYKNIIITRASWNITKLVKPHSRHEEEAVFEEIMKKYNLPNHVVLSEGDNELLLDLSNKLAKNILLEKVSKSDIFLQEFLFSQFQSPIKDSDGLTYANEIVIPMYTKNEIEQDVIPPYSTNLQRIFPLGSIWVYAKIFCGHLFADTLLQTSIPTIIQELKVKGVVNKWFFIRYSDPTPHIRLRIEGVSKNDFAIITQTIQDKLALMLDGNQIVNIQFDSYVREIERYTSECMILSEELFFHDSEYVLNTFIKYPIIKERWLPAILGVDELLKSVGFSISEKLNFCKKMKSLFSVEFGANKSHDRQFNQKFRERKKLIESHLLGRNEFTQSLNRSGIIEKIMKVIDSSNLNGKLIDKKHSLIASYIHMYINRLFPVDQRLYEFAIYHFLNNYYRMIIGKHKNQKVFHS